VIGVFEAGARREARDPSFRAGDDPQPSAFAVQELELSFAADVDPYFRMRTFLTMPSDGGIEIEESFLETTALPRGLGLKVGAFRSSFRRNGATAARAAGWLVRTGLRVWVDCATDALFLGMGLYLLPKLAESSATPEAKDGH
jgi:hypothetical protein